ncbi:hypothetical protein UY3_02239 [Chelonia mydas]|uniref:U1-type domain-containing protein n=1 Tax=Chelonia mydas TaxID=8469 RepID=M7BRH4_CHEMY|nr:hypothetical protein UY3_02239 [Chelonia mydas]
MKRPLSLPHPAENRTHLAETAGSQSEQRTKREKKHQSFTLCEVCNIQLNSPAQAQIHYNGKSHQKRLKQLNKGKVPTGQGSLNPDGSVTVRPEFAALRCPRVVPVRTRARSPVPWVASARSGLVWVPFAQLLELEVLWGLPRPLA